MKSYANEPHIGAHNSKYPKGLTRGACVCIFVTSIMDRLREKDLVQGGDTINPDSDGPEILAELALSNFAPTDEEIVQVLLGSGITDIHEIQGMALLVKAEMAGEIDKLIEVEE